MRAHAVRHHLPLSLHAEFTAFCAVNDLDYHHSLAEAIIAHDDAIKASLGSASGDSFDDCLADAITLWLDEYGPRFDPPVMSLP
jgi:hypothetical protein